MKLPGSSLIRRIRRMWGRRKKDQRDAAHVRVSVSDLVTGDSVKCVGRNPGVKVRSGMVASRNGNSVTLVSSSKPGRSVILDPGEFNIYRVAVGKSKDCCKGRDAAAAETGRVRISRKRRGSYTIERGSG